MTTNNQTTTFAYDADGQRVLTTHTPGDMETKVYTPFPDYEMEDPPGAGGETFRITYRLAGQMVAVRAAGVLYYTLTDHLGNVLLLTRTDGSILAGSAARYDPFGNYRTTPTTSPGTSARGFTGHAHNNTGTNDLGLIYMNARYYLPEVGRFASPDSIVPEPGNPQSFNRYSYVRNSPLNFTDPTGHSECQILCEGNAINEQEIKFGSAYGGEWDPEQQTTYRAKAKAITTALIETAVGALWEPADWAFALRDGFQWYDSIGFLPLIPATVGRHFDDANNLVARVKTIHGQLDPYAQRRRTTAILLAEDSQGISYRLVSSSQPTLDSVQLNSLQLGEIPIEGPRAMHAEAKLVIAAEERHLKPLFMAASRPICRACAAFLAEYDITPMTGLKR